MPRFIHKRRRTTSLPKSILILAPIFLANVLTCLSISTLYTDLDTVGGKDKGVGEKLMNHNHNNITQDDLPSSSAHGAQQTRKKSYQNSLRGRNRNQPQPPPSPSPSSNDLRKQQQPLSSSIGPSPFAVAESPFRLNEFCKTDSALEKVICTGVNWKDDLPSPLEHNFHDIQEATFVNLSNSGDIHISHIKKTFPRVVILKLAFVSGGSGRVLSNFFQQKRQHIPHGSSSSSKIVGEEEQSDEFKWESVRVLNLTHNRLSAEWLPKTLMTSFPQLETLDLSRNNITSFIDIVTPEWLRLETIDLSGNPLDCTGNLDWIVQLKLVNADRTLCELPPHQNRPKPILKVYPLVKRVREECRLNCTCFVDYIWEQDKTIHAKTTVNCSNRNFMDFPDPDKMPHPTDTLYLSNNHIESLERFVEDPRYAKLNVMNLFLNNNNISSISPLEGSDWFYHFQILSLRNNHISEIPVYALENVLRQNKRLYFIDLSQNEWKCDCNTVQNFKVWLLRHSTYAKNVEEVLCSQTHEQVRHISASDWCKPDETPIIEILDLVSITLALLIVATICKVYYDYWQYKKNGRLPWLVSKM